MVRAGLWRAVVARERPASWWRMIALGAGSHTPLCHSRFVHAPAEPSDITLVHETLKIASLVTAFRSRGHFVATLDPLGRTLGRLIEGNDEAASAEPENAKDLFNDLLYHVTVLKPCITWIELHMMVT